MDSNHLGGLQPTNIPKSVYLELAARLLVNVKEVRVGRAWAILEHIVPPPIRRIANPHVIRDDIHQESHAVLRERVRKRFQLRLRAELRVDGAMVRHIVAVETAPLRLEEGGGLEPSYA